MKKNINHTSFLDAGFSFEEIMRIEQAISSDTSLSQEEAQKHMKNFITSSRSQVHV
jgi:hypothetical protein